MRAVTGPVNPRQEWAVTQLQEAEVTQEISTSVLRLLEIWWTMNHRPDTRLRTLEIFNALAQGHSLKQAAPPVDEVWADARMGQLVVANQVRVKEDAYAGDAGVQHNGRRGVVVAIRYGDIIVDYRDGKLPVGKGVHHPAIKLQLRVK